MSPRSLSLLLAGLLAGCALGPDYQRPAVPVPEGFRGAGSQSEIRSFGDYAWFELVADPQLQALISEALDNNRDLQIAAARVEEAEAQLGVVRGGLFPQVQGSASAGRQRVSENTVSPAPAGNPFQANQVALALGWELDFWGRLRRLSEAARGDLLATEEARAAVRAGLVTQLAQAWFSLLELDMETGIAQRTLASREESLRLVTLRRRGGVASRIEQRQAEVLVNAARSAQVQLGKSTAQTENLISQLVGRPPGRVGQPAPNRGLPLEAQTVTDDLPVGLPSALLARRPDVKQAEQQLVAANARIGAARAARFPTISLTGSAGMASQDLSDLFKGPSRLWSFAPTVSVPIFTGGSLQAQEQASEARQRQALGNYDKTVQTAFRETADSIVALQASRDYLREQESLAVSLRDAVRLSDMRYKGGVTSYLEYLDTERQLFDAENGLARARRDVLLARLALYKALGGGWQMPAVAVEAGR